MKTFLIVGVFGAIVYFMVRRGFEKKTNEVDESIALQQDGEKRGKIANLLNILRNPPLAQVGLRQLFTANMNPFSGSLGGAARDTQLLPKFAGVDSGSTLNSNPDSANVATDVERFYIPSEWLNPT